MNPATQYHAAMSDCTLCPRNCHADRRNGERGFCGEGDQIRAARAALHYWEEPCISGISGSGAVFFTGCSLGCVYCQNHSIAHGAVGKEITVERLAEVFLELQAKNARNINLVTATHFIPQVAAALGLAKEQGLTIPIVYNTSGYEKSETLRQLEGLIQIYLPDFKYLDSRLAEKYSSAPDYPQVAKSALAEMIRQVGEPEFEGKKPGFQEEGDPGFGKRNCFEFQGESGPESEEDQESEQTMLRGVVVRHLVLPGRIEESKRVIKYLYETYGDRIFISILNQYTPMPQIGGYYPELNRRVTEEEYDEVVDFAISIGVENGFIQEGDTAEESFIPEFDITGL